MHILYTEFMRFDPETPEEMESLLLDRHAWSAFEDDAGHFQLIKLRDHSSCGQTGEDNDHTIRAPALDLDNRFQAGEMRHGDVADDEIRLLLANLRYQLEAVHRLGDNFILAQILQQCSYALANEGMIVGDDRAH